MASTGAGLGREEAPDHNDDGTRGTRPRGVPVLEAVEPARGSGLQGGHVDRKRSKAEVFMYTVRWGLLADVVAPGGGGEGKDRVGGAPAPYRCRLGPGDAFGVFLLQSLSSPRGRCERRVACPAEGEG